MTIAKKRVGMPLLILVVVAGFYWKLTLTRQFEWIWGPDLAQQVLPWFEEEARAWHHGSIALWDPYVWAGQPLLGQAQPGIAYPLNWVLFALPLRHDGLIRWWALEWYFVFLRVMAFSFCYLLCRDLGRSRVASLIGSAVFALGGYIGNTGWPQLVSGAVWLPLVFLFQLRAGHGQDTFRNAVLSGTFLGVAWLSGHHQAPMFLMLASGAVWIYFIFRSGRLDFRMARAAALALLLTVLTGALQILPSYEYGQIAKRWVGAPDPIAWNQPVPYSVHEEYDLKPFELIGLIFPHINTRFDPFIGVSSVGLALLGLAAGWRDVRVRLLAAVGLGGIVYALGQHSVFQGLLYAALPELDKARQPSAAIVVFQFGVAVLTAFGVERLGAVEPSKWDRRVAWGIFGFGLFGLGIFEALFFVNKSSFPADTSVVLTPFVAFAFVALVYAAMRKGLTGSQCRVIMLLLVLLELGNNTGTVVTPRADESRMRWLNLMRGNTDIAEFLKQQEPFPRANVAGEAFAENWGALHDVEMWGGSLPSLTGNMLRFDFWTLPSRLLWGVQYTISAQPTSEGDLANTAASGLRVYRHKEAFPRAWAVHELVQAPNAEAGNRMVQEQLLDFHHMGFTLTATPELEVCENQDHVALAQHATDKVIIHASMGCSGVLILSDVYAPGWQADIDGKPALIYEVNAAMRGVVVPRGDHRVTMRYRPASASLGGVLSLIGIAAALVAAAWPKRVAREERQLASSAFLAP